MIKAYYLGAEIAEMIEFIGDIVVFRCESEKYATIATTGEITLEEE